MSEIHRNRLATDTVPINLCLYKQCQTRMTELKTHNSIGLPFVWLLPNGGEGPRRRRVTVLTAGFPIIHKPKTCHLLEPD